MKNFCLSFAPSFQYALLASFPLHRVFCCQNKLCNLLLGITNLGHNPGKSKCTVPAGLRTILQRVDMEARPAQVQDQGHICTTSSQERKHLQTTYHGMKKQPQQEAEEQDAPRKKSRLVEMSCNTKRTLAAPRHHLNQTQELLF